MSDKNIEESVEVSVPSEENTQTETDEKKEESSTSTVEDATEKPRNKVQERINELTRDKYELRSAVDEVRSENQRLKEQLDELKKPNQQIVAPKYEDFSDQDQYESARDEYLIQRTKQEALNEFEQRQAEQASRAQQEQIQQEHVKKRQKFADNVKAESSQYEDLERVVYSAPISNGPVADYILMSDKGVGIAYHLGTHLDELDRINQLDPISATRELALLEARLQKPQPKKLTNAQEPIKPLGNSERVDKDPDSMSANEWLAWRNKTKKVR